MHATKALRVAYYGTEPCSHSLQIPELTSLKSEKLPSAVGQRLNLAWYADPQNHYVQESVLRSGLRRRLGMVVHGDAMI
eukprot:6462802-Amphidinium_carterae.1